ncbi:RNA-directed DNA polymerase, eukaryota [Tanacetum coccineum]
MVIPCWPDPNLLSSRAIYAPFRMLLSCKSVKEGHNFDVDQGVDISTVGDICIWSLANDDIFSVKEARQVIDDKVLPFLATSTSWDKILPRKVNIFMWRLMLDRLPYHLNLLSCGIDIQSISCPSCNGNVESSNHIIFECDIALEVWRLVRIWCDITSPTFTSLLHWKNWTSLWQASKEKKHRFFIIFVSSLWYEYIKNHKKIVKNGQARTRESIEYKAEARKVKPQSKSAKKSQSFALNSLIKEAQAVTSRNDSLAILRVWISLLSCVRCVTIMWNPMLICFSPVILLVTFGLWFEDGATLNSLRSAPVMIGTFGILLRKLRKI